MTSTVLSRRTMMTGSILLGAGASGLGSAQAQTAAGADPYKPVPMPAQVPAKEGLAQLADTRLFYWDTGGDGQPIVLMHPASGSALIWGYQQPVFVKAGYRVIAYSRRGHNGSDPVPKENPGTASGDLDHLMDFLGVKKFHAVSSAAGVSVTMDYALSHADRLYSIVYACGTGGVQDEHYVKMLDDLRPKGFAEMPFEFQEVGPSYRAANPEGTRQWADLHHKAVTGVRTGQKPANKVTLKALGSMKVPTLVIAGDADLWWPPTALRMVAPHIPNGETLIVPEAGHSVYWEQPEMFNRAVLDFVGRHST
jgi:pimeloyl-ACP methyl ester carboxylesterase